MSRLVVALATGALLASGWAVLAWFDFVPGGYRLRGLVEDHEVRRAREQRERSDARLALFETENPTVPDGAIVFIGSSTIERFPLESEFPAASCVDRGIGNETAIECLARLEASLPAAEPAGFVVYLGSLDFRRVGVPPRELVARVGRVLDALSARHPGVPVLQIGLLSERDATPEFVARWRRANQALEAAARARGAAWVDVDREPVTSSSGQLAETLSDDRLHLSAAGYRHLAAWICADGGTVGERLCP